MSWLGNIFNFLAGAQYSTSPTPLTNGSTGPLLCDAYGRLLVVTTGAGTPVNTTTNSWADAGALANSKVVKASAGTLFQLFGVNESVNKRWVMVFDAASLPGNGQAPIFAFPVAGGGTFSLDLGSRGRAFASGIVWASSSTVGTLTVSTDSPADLWASAEYL